MSGPFANAANELTSIASRTASVAGRINSTHGDMEQISNLISRVYEGTAGGADLGLQAAAIMREISDLTLALKRMEDDLRSAASRAARVTGG